MQASSTRKWGVVVVVTLGMFMSTLDNSIVSVTLPQMQKAFNTNVDAITWVISVYFLAQAAVIPVVGYVSDFIGSKRVFLLTLGLFTLGSFLCAIAPTEGALIAFRVLQGIGGGALLPVGFAIAYRTFPPDQRASITSIISIPIIMAPSFGPTLGGYLGTYFNWNAIFTINVPIGILTLLMGYYFLEADNYGQPQGARKRFDILGLLLSMVGSTTLVYAINQASTKGWTDQTVLIPLLIGAGTLIAFVVAELRVNDPVLDLRLFTNYTFSIASVLTWMLMGMVYGGLFFLPTFFENVQGDTPLVAGLYMIMTGVSTGVGLAIAGKIYNRVGARFLIVLGMLLLAVGTYGLTQLKVDTTGESLQVWLFVRGVGVGFTTQSLQVLALSVVSNRAMARASSLYNVTRQVAGALGIAVLTAYLTQQATTHATDIGRALQIGLQTHQLTGDAAACAQVPQGIQACIAQHATAIGIGETFLLTLFVYAACAGLGLIVGRDPTIQTQKEVAGEKVETVTAGKEEVQVEHAAASREEVQVASAHSVISTLTANGDEIPGPDVLLWRYPENNIANGSILTVANNQFCVLLSRGTILNVYETGQHTLAMPDDPVVEAAQMTFNDEPIRLHEALYINRAKLVATTSGVALSRDIVEVDYSIDASIHIATPEDAAQLVQHLAYEDHPLEQAQSLRTRDMNMYAGPVIEQMTSQLIQITPLEKIQKLQEKEVTQYLRGQLQRFLSTYGITVDEVQVRVAPRGERVEAPLSQKSFGISELDAVNHYAATTKNSTEQYLNGQQEELKQELSAAWHNRLDSYTHEIAAIQAELESIRSEFGQRIDAQSARLQELSGMMNADLQASAPIQKVTPHSRPQSSSTTGQFKVPLTPLGGRIP